MTWDSVPYFVGGGAVHSPEVMRSLAYAATGGTEGVVLPGDLKVVPLAVPGQGVRVSDGGAYVLSRAAGQTEQTYVARNPTSDTIAITPTGSSGGKSVMIGVRIEDPWIAGEPWSDPVDPTIGPYVFSRAVDCTSTARVWQSVSGRSTETAYALARIDMPANTGTITAAMITDLRALARPRSQRVVAKGTIVDQTVTLTTGWQDFPQNPITGIAVPSWATHATIVMQSTLRYLSGNAAGNLQGFLGPAGQLDATTLYGDQYMDTTVAGGEYRTPIINPSDGYWAIPAAIRGTTAVLSTRIKGAVAGGKVRAGAGDYYFADITFVERSA